MYVAGIFNDHHNSTMSTYHLLIPPFTVVVAAFPLQWRGDCKSEDIITSLLPLLRS